MGLLLFLRQNESYSYFRRALHLLVKSPDANRLLLGSGYFWEDIPTDRRQYSVLHDGLLNEIVAAKPKEVILIGGKFSGYSWTQRFRMFAQRLRNAGITISAFKVKGNNWHAKIAFALKDDHPLAGLIGSSNLTRPAYQEGMAITFNHEADVLIWMDKPKFNNHFRGGFVKDNLDDPLSPVDLVMNHQIKQPDEEKRLEALFKEAMSLKGLKEFE
jgi:hypothetical protein